MGLRASPQEPGGAQTEAVTGTQPQDEDSSELTRLLGERACLCLSVLEAFETGLPASPRGLGLEKDEYTVSVVPPPTVSQRFWQPDFT